MFLVDLNIRYIFANVCGVVLIAITIGDGTHVSRQRPIQIVFNILKSAYSLLRLGPLSAWLDDQILRAVNLQKR